MDEYLNGESCIVFINAHDRNAKFNLFEHGGAFDVGKFYYHSKSVTYVVEDEVGESPGCRRWVENLE